MHRIHRSAGRLLAIVAAAALTACASDETTAPRDGQPDPQPALAGEWVLQAVNAKPIPAEVAGGTDDGITWSLHVVADTLRLTPDGRWVQRARMYQPQSNGLNFNFSFNDHGTWTVQDGEVRFESEWIQNVRFTGVMLADGRLVLRQDLLLDETIGPLRLELKR